MVSTSGPLLLLALNYLLLTTCLKECGGVYAKRSLRCGGVYAKRCGGVYACKSPALLWKVRSAYWVAGGIGGFEGEIMSAPRTVPYLRSGQAFLIFFISRRESFRKSFTT